MDGQDGDGDLIVHPSDSPEQGDDPGLTWRRRSSCRSSWPAWATGGFQTVHDARGGGGRAWLTWAFYGPLVKIWRAALALGFFLGMLASFVYVLQILWQPL